MQAISWTSGIDGPASRKPGAGGAGIAMISTVNGTAHSRHCRYFGYMSFRFTRIYAGRLIKITIIEKSVPRNR